MIRQTWLTVKEAGQASGMGERFIRRMVNERRIRFYRVGRFIRIEERDLDDFMHSNLVQPNRGMRKVTRRAPEGGASGDANNDDRPAKDDHRDRT